MLSILCHFHGRFRGQIRIPAEDLLASQYAAASSYFAIYLRCDCAGVPGTIVCPNPIVNDGASQA
jgi:hypothetical protein